MKKGSAIVLIMLALMIYVSFGKESSFTDTQNRECNPLKVEEGKKANVLCFTMTDCPIANGYSQRFNQLKQEFGKKGFDFYLVHVDWDTTQAKALEHQKDYKLDLKVVLDPKHKLVQKTGVTITPEVAILMPNGEVAYRGRIDNWYEGFGKKRNVINKTELADALNAIDQGKEVSVKFSKAVGCSIPDLPAANL